MKFEEIENHWKTDSIIRKDILDIELAKCSELLYKYQNFLFLESNSLKKLQNKLSKTYLQLYRYYSCASTKKEIEELSRTPFQHKVLKSDLHIYINADDLYTEYLTAITYQEKKCEYLKQIIQSLNSRNYTIKSMIDFIKWTSGMQ